jgi:hypothetical protein
MQLAEVGRNEPCPCGSGRKYKKCCLGKESPAAASAPGDADLAALVDGAIESDDWDPVHALFDQVFGLFDPGAPLEHVRFRSDFISSWRPDVSELSRLADTAWLRFCEREIAYVLERYEVSAVQRNGLRLMIYMLRRFGAKSPVVEAVAELQANEYQARARHLADVLSRHGLTMDEANTGWGELAEWLARVRPTVLPFADWFTLHASPEDEAEALWLSGIGMRVCDVCFETLERPEVADAKQWLRLAAIALFSRAPDISLVLARLTPPVLKTDNERMVHTVLTTDQHDARMRGSIEKIIAETDERNDFAGAALLRGIQQQVRFRKSRSSVLGQAAERGRGVDADGAAAGGHAALDGVDVDRR